ncbi:MAG: carbon-nitrogen family hydrolase [Rhodothermales bacterium]
MQVVLVQLDVAWERPEANFRAVERLLGRVTVSPGSLIVLPEMFSVGFTMNVAAAAEEEGGPTERFLEDMAARHEAYVVGGVCRMGSDGRGRNDALVVAPDGRRVDRYTKLHPFSYAGETDHYAPGDDIIVFDWDGLKTAPFICYDLRFPEAYRHAAMRGAGLLVTIANFPSARVRHWTDLLIARAIENQAYCVGVNRCGSDPNVAYPGRSVAVDPLGHIVAEAAAEETVVVVHIDGKEPSRVRSAFPALRDARADLLGGSSR